MKCGSGFMALSESFGVRDAYSHFYESCTGCVYEDGSGAVHSI